MSEPNRDANSTETSLSELALLFARLGATAFGGPAAHIAMMHDEVVARRKWLSEERFLDLLGATNLIPGPNSTELAIHIGWQRRGLSGLVVAGAAFILPALLLTSACGWAYTRYGSVPTAIGLLYGVKPVMIGVVAQAIWRLAPRALRTRRLALLGLGATAVAALGVSELLVLLGAGLLAVALARALDSARDESTSAWRGLAPVGPIAFGAGASGLKLSGIFWVFLKTGSLLFGSGYVLLAF
ncbi:MAG TPA: chromate efflux transporter, partial [Polyangiaceae bacterium]|nr:chromate efflux transporter [Polyangiaceae bacterium]